MKTHLLLLLSFFIAGCEKTSKVYIPGENFQQSIHLGMSKQQVSVNEEIALYVERKSSGWVEKLESEISEAELNGCLWRNNQPPDYEEEVSPNISFSVKPEGYSTFNVGIESLEGRTVQFSKSGTYTIKGHSAVWCEPGMDSNEIIIEVVEK